MMGSEIEHLCGTSRMRHDTPAQTHPAESALELKPASARCCNGETVTCASASAAMALLEQAVGFIESIDDASYSQPSRLLPGGTIGKHFRHVVDHFAATLAPLRADAVIEYDRRERDVPMESCRRTAVAQIRSVMDALSLAKESAS